MKPRDTPTDKLETESNYYRILSDEGSTCSKLATTLKCGGLWPSLCMIKVSPVQDVQPEQSRGEHDICVYNMDYKDTEQVMRVENLMRFAGVTTILTYKPDIFSALGIYRNDKWVFRPTIYSSRVMLMEGKNLSAKHTVIQLGV